MEEAEKGKKRDVLYFISKLARRVDPFKEAYW